MEFVDLDSLEAVPDEVDVVVHSLYGTTSTDNVTRPAKKLMDLPPNVARKVMLVWSNFKPEDSSGRAPDCVPGVFRACTKLAADAKCAGVIFRAFDKLAERPELIEEIRQVSRELGIQQTQ